MSLEENMEDILNISAEVVEEPKTEKKERESNQDDRQKDYEYTGENYTPS